MNILYYTWNENSASDLLDSLSKLQISYTKVSHTLSNYDFDLSFTNEIEALLDRSDFDLIFTFNYFPILSRIAQQHKIPYVCWVYDCPHNTLYSETITNSYNHFYLFDRNMCVSLQARGAKHVTHFPLAVNTSRLDQLLQTVPDEPEYDISFVGSLYENGDFDQIKYMPDYVRGFFSSIIQVQQKIWGFNFADQILTDSVVEQLDRFVQLGDDPNYNFSHKQLYADMINKKITSIDRISHLNLLADYFTVDLFTASDTTHCPNCHAHGYVNYQNEMPVIFHQSKINLNLSLRSITSGIPLRCLDIMGAGGFLLTNYQPELCEFFSPNEDFVFFNDAADLIEQTRYYLQHDSERKQIAENGRKKVRMLFNYTKKVPQMFDIS